MTAESLKQLKDEQLREFIGLADTELKTRAEQRKQAAMEEIRRLAATVSLQVSFGSERGKAGKNGATLKVGARYQNPTDPAKVYIVGKGRPPAWFDQLRAKGRLPMPNDQATMAPKLT